MAALPKLNPPTGDGLATGAGGVWPVPVMVTLCMLLATPLLLSTKLSEAVSPEAFAGLNVRVTVQLEPAGTVLAVEQVIELTGKSAAFVPVTVGLLAKARDAPPVFVTVTLIGALMAPTEVVGKASAVGGVGVSITTGTVPVPVTLTVWVPGDALSENVSVAVSCTPAFAAVGVNLRVTVQLAAALTVFAVEQVLAEMVKSVAPESAGLDVKVSGPLPEFVSMTVMVGLGLVPTGTEPNGTTAG